MRAVDVNESTCSDLGTGEILRGLDIDTQELGVWEYVVEVLKEDLARGRAIRSTKLKRIANPEGLALGVYHPCQQYRAFAMENADLKEIAPDTLALVHVIEQSQEMSRLLAKPAWQQGASVPEPLYMFGIHKVLPISPLSAPKPLGNTHQLAGLDVEHPASH